MNVSFFKSPFVTSEWVLDGNSRCGHFPFITFLTEIKRR